MIPVEPYYNEDHTKAAVLISYGYGTGWSSENGDSRLAYDKRIIEFYLQHYQDRQWMKNTGVHHSDAYEELLTFLQSLPEYKDIDYFNLLGFEDCGIEWIPLNTPFMIEEYDGSESLVRRTAIDWIYLQ